ncbi:MAG: hypothetical protein ABF289_18630 [Clostridiales bacterium]
MGSHEYLKVIKGKEIKDKEIMMGIEIDKIVYPEEFIGTFNVCKSWQIRNPDNTKLHK